MGLESPKNEQTKSTENPESVHDSEQPKNEEERNERIKEAVDRAIELIESDPNFDWLIHTYTSRGYEDFHYDDSKSEMTYTRDGAYQIPLYSTDEQVRRPEFKFHAQVRDDDKIKDGKLFVTWMNLGSRAFQDNNPFLLDPRGSYFACALRWRDTQEAMQEIGSQALKRYLQELAQEETSTDLESLKEMQEFMFTLVDACNSKWSSEYWSWIKTLRQ